MTRRDRGSDAEMEIANRYAAQGYEIIRKPPPNLLPPNVGPYAPDLVAVRGDERVAVEIVARPDAQKVERLKTLADAFREAGWRFDVIVLGGTASESEQPTYLPPPRLKERLRAAQQTATRAGDVAGGLVLAWTVIEAALRQLIGNATTETSPMTSARLIKEALSLGILQERDWEYLNQLLVLRNRAVHGEEMAGTVNRKSFERALRLAHRLVESLDAAQMRSMGRA